MRARTFKVRPDHMIKPYRAGTHPTADGELVAEVLTGRRKSTTPVEASRDRAGGRNHSAILDRFPELWAEILKHVPSDDRRVALRKHEIELEAPPPPPSSFCYTFPPPLFGS